ncbi:hemolysin [Burkholderia territorii]|nr:hemolysin [Burkholderia territorii]
MSEKVAVHAKKYDLPVGQAHNELTTQANLQARNGSPDSFN